MAYAGSLKKHLYKFTEPQMKMAHPKWMIHFDIFDEPFAWHFDGINENAKSNICHP
jgi:hypothetical protein